MFQLIVTVMSIGLTALVIAGGVSYFNSDTGTRVETQHQMQGHFDGISTAIATYRTSNNGYLAPGIESIYGLLPGGTQPKLSAAPNDFAWSFENAADPDDYEHRFLCFSTQSFSKVGKGVLLGLAAFADKIATTRSGLVVELGSTCSTTAPVTGHITDDLLKSSADNSGLAIAFKGL